MCRGKWPSVASRRFWLAAALAPFACVGAPTAPALESSSRALRGVDALQAVVRNGQASGDCVDNAEWSYIEGDERFECATLATLGPLSRELCEANEHNVRDNCPLTCQECSASSVPASPGDQSGGACVDDATWSYTEGAVRFECMTLERFECDGYGDENIATQIQAACPVTCGVCQPGASDDSPPGIPHDCVDDSIWSDTMYGDGTFTCAQAAAAGSGGLCRDDGPAARELRRGCPMTCNACEEAELLNACFDDTHWTDIDIGGDGSASCKDLSEDWSHWCNFNETVGPRVRSSCPFTCGTCEEAVHNDDDDNRPTTPPVAHCSLWHMTMEVEGQCMSLKPWDNYLVIPAYVLLLCVPLMFCICVPMLCAKISEKRKLSVLGDLGGDPRALRRGSRDTSDSSWSAGSNSTSTKSSSGTSRSERSDRSDRRRGRGRRDVYGDGTSAATAGGRHPERTHQAHGTTQGRSHQSQAEGLELTSITSTSLDKLLDEKLIMTRYCYAGAIANGNTAVMMAAAFSGTKGWECVYRKPNEREGVRVDESKSLLHTVTSGQAPDYGLWLGGVRYKVEDSNFQFQYSPGVIFPIWYGRAIKHVNASWIMVPQSVHVVRVVTATQSFIVCGFCMEDVSQGPHGDPSCKLPYQWPPPPSLKCQGVLNLAAHLQATFGA